MCLLPKLAIGQKSIVSTCRAPIGWFGEQCPLVTKFSGEAWEGLLLSRWGGKMTLAVQEADRYPSGTISQV